MNHLGEIMHDHIEPRADCISCQHNAEVVPPAISRRVQLTPLDEHVDLVMQRIPGLTLHLTHAEDRARLRTYLHMALESYLEKLAWDLAKAADRGIRQAITLMLDPSYYQDRQRTLRQSRERSQRQAEEARQQYLAERAAVQTERERLEREGKLAPIRGPRRPPEPAT